MRFQGKNEILFPRTTATGGLSNYISDTNIKNFQPMNINFGLIEGLNVRIRDKKQKNQEIAQRALGAIKEIVEII
jgi:methylenetetrahydrofolate--tRNA-(uracil-5-)-methyltransferase